MGWTGLMYAVQMEGRAQMEELTELHMTPLALLSPPTQTSFAERLLANLYQMHVYKSVNRQWKLAPNVWTIGCV